MQKRFDPKVFQLGYVTLDTPDVGRTREHYAEAIGLRETDKGSEGELFLSVGYDHHNVVLRPAERKAIGNIGFQLKPGIELASFLKDAEAFGLRGQIKSDSQPGIGALVEIDGPAGLPLQFYSELAAPAPGYGHHGVAPVRLGHVAVINPDAKNLMKLFEDFLGFWFTDTIEGVANFYTCNREHHVINILDAPENRYHHIAFQLKENAAHPVAADILRQKGVRQEWGPSRHTAGHNLAGYHFDPDRVLIELYTDMDVFIPELNMCEPRPWHEHFPMQPRHWKMNELNAWGAEFVFDLARAA